MSENCVHVEASGGVAKVTLNRPDERNSFNDEVIAKLTDAFRMAAAAEDIRAVLLCGAGKAFSAGADLGWMKRAAEMTEAENAADALKMAAMFEAIYFCPKPVVAKVHGAAMGGAMGLIAACDMAVAAESAKFAFTEVRLGLAPAVIAPYVIAKIGAGGASRYFLTGERFDAETAMRIGLVSEVAAEGELDSAAHRLIDALLKGSPNAQREIKKLIQTVAGFSAENFRDYTARLIASLRVSAEGQEGLASFFEKRLPKWAADADDAPGAGGRAK